VVGQTQLIQNFVVKENLTQNGKLAIIAVDSADQPLEHINGTFQFSLNGFKQELAFHDGIAVLKQPVESSTFAMFKHTNQAQTVARFYYIHKSDNALKPIKIQAWLLLIIPVLILLIAYAFKRFISVFIILAIVFLYFHFSKGLDISQLLESVFLGIKGVF